MPQTNTIKLYAANSYYHVYTRGINKQTIFLEPQDDDYFLYLFDRYLAGERKIDKMGTPYPSYGQSIELMAYCLMSNHIHMLIYQKADPQALKKFMASLMTAYSKYFNLKYKRVGSLFESRYKAKLIDNDSYLTHISRYIHMNPRRWLGYKYSSLKYIFDEGRPKWLKCQAITREFSGREEYISFLEAYHKNKNLIHDIKHQLADKSAKI